jgi:hypothetical protein
MCRARARLRKVVVVMHEFSRQGALAIGLCLIVQPLLVATAPAQQPKPNILFILADNTGYDIGA